MYRASYSYSASYARTLSFQDNDYFILLKATDKKNWWQVCDERGNVGFIPSNYVECVPVSVSFLMEFVSNCLKVARNFTNEAGGAVPKERQDLIHKLNDLLRQLGSMNGKDILGEPLLPKRKAPPPPTRNFHSPTNLAKCDSDMSLNQAELPCPGVSYITAQPGIRETGPNPAADQAAPADDIERRLMLRLLVTDSAEKAPPDNVPKQSHSSSEMSGLRFRENSVEGSKSCPEVVHKQHLKSSHNAIEVLAHGEGNSRMNPKIAHELVEQVRRHTQLSYELSRVAVRVVLNQLQDYVPLTGESLNIISSELMGPLKMTPTFIEDTYDAQRLRRLFKQLTSCKEDEQQRSWMLYEDEHIITEDIKELSSILDNANMAVSRHVMSEDEYQGIISLIQYYQMETRWSIRQLLLEAFEIMCRLDTAIIGVMVNSILPLELARDMQTNQDDLIKLKDSASLLIIILSRGEPMPITHLEYLGERFVDFLLDSVEDLADTDISEEVSDLFVKLVFVYNLQFLNISENITMETLGKRLNAKVFIEKCLLLFNREEEPSHVFKNQLRQCHSVLKLFIDLFSSQKTAALVYTNDIKVLIDVIVRQLSDLSPGDERRNQYLELCRLVMRNTNYAEHLHKKDEMARVFARIFVEETDKSQVDQQLVKEISQEFPMYFKV